MCSLHGHLALSTTSKVRGGIPWLITLTQGCVCTACLSGLVAGDPSVAGKERRKDLLEIGLGEVGQKGSLSGLGLGL